MHSWFGSVSIAMIFSLVMHGVAVDIHWMITSAEEEQRSFLLALSESEWLITAGRSATRYSYRFFVLSLYVT